VGIYPRIRLEGFCCRAERTTAMSTESEVHGDSRAAAAYVKARVASGRVSSRVNQGRKRGWVAVEPMYPPQFSTRITRFARSLSLFMYRWYTIYEYTSRYNIRCLHATHGCTTDYHPDMSTQSRQSLTRTQDRARSSARWPSAACQISNIGTPTEMSRALFNSDTASPNSAPTPNSGDRTA
jgi:hypothetical protein